MTRQHVLVGMVGVLLMAAPAVNAQGNGQNSLGNPGQGNGSVENPSDSKLGKLHGYHLTVPWSDTAASNAAGKGKPGGGGGGGGTSTGIPTSTYSIKAAKNGTTYSGVLVGASPYSTAPANTTIKTVIVPLSITIGSTTFNPNAVDACDGDGQSTTVQRLLNSPLFTPSALSMNGQGLGNVQYIDALRLAEFKNTGFSATNELAPVSVAGVYPLSAGSNGILYGSGCQTLGIVSYSWISSQISNTILPALTSQGVVGPDRFVLFLVRNVVQSSSSRPSVSNCCILGYHSAQGSPATTYAIADWDTTGDFGAGVADGSIAAHEIGEWMNDPFGTNPTPAWGGLGQVSSCQSNLENGDPLSGSLQPAITLNNYAYHMQELAFFGWFFDAPTSTAQGAGGKYSSNGTFSGPSKACPSGGSY